MQAPEELRDVARHVVWFKPPEKTLSDPDFFLAHLMTHGTYEEVKIAKRFFSREDFRHALEHAPPGVFDTRSWAYWNTILDRLPVAPLPKRNLEQASEGAGKAARQVPARHSPLTTED